jgi:hypothetical protein
MGGHWCDALHLLAAPVPVQRASELGPALLVGLSTVRFRSNTFSVHEVYVDDEQVAWFEALLAAHPGRPVVVFTHAPPIGSGLKVVQNVHVKNRSARSGLNWAEGGGKPGCIGVACWSTAVGWPAAG